MGGATNQQGQANASNQINQFFGNLAAQGWTNKDGTVNANNKASDVFGIGTTALYSALAVAAKETGNMPGPIGWTGNVVSVVIGVATAPSQSSTTCAIFGTLASIPGGIVGTVAGASVGGPAAPATAVIGGALVGIAAQKLATAACQTALGYVNGEPVASGSSSASAPANLQQTLSTSPVSSATPSAPVSASANSTAIQVVQFRSSPDYSGTDGAYAVQRGQTLSAIAKSNGVSLNDLVAANPQITDPNSIRTGQVIRLPANATSYIPGASSSTSIPNDAAQTNALTSVFDQVAGQSVDVVTENSGRIAVLSASSGTATLINNDGSISQMSLSVYNQMAQSAYNQMVSNGYVNSSDLLSLVNYQDGLYGTTNMNGSVGTVVTNEGMIYQDSIGNIVAQSTAGDLYAYDSATQKSLFAMLDGSGASANLVTNIQAYDAVTGDIAANIKTFDTSCTLASEQLATYSASRDLTQVINLANSAVIGSAVIDGLATFSQLAQENDLAVQMGVASSFTSSGVDLFTSMGLASNAAATQALQTADQTYTGSNAITLPVITSDASLGNYIATKSTDGSAIDPQSAGRINATKTDIIADPTILALEDGALAVRMAQQNPSTINILIAFQKVSIAGGVISPEYFSAIATQLGMANPNDLNKLLIRGGTTLATIIAAYQNPTPTGVAQAAIQLLGTGVGFTNDLKRATAGALGLSTTDLTQMDKLLAYGGAGLALVSALKNPTPQNIIQSSQQLVNALDSIRSSPQFGQLSQTLSYAGTFLSVVDFAKNPDPYTALSATFSIGSQLGWIAPELMAAVAIAQMVLPGPTQAIVNTMYSAVSQSAQWIANHPAESIGIAAAIFFFTPLTLNLTGGNVHTSILTGGSPLFDMKGDGTQVKTGWITPDEGFLVRDVNGDGKINSINEMFSDKVTASGSLSAFGSLATLDSNLDVNINQNDHAWGDLKIWVDKNGDGISQANELYTLGQLGINSINLNAQHGFTYDNGNIIGDTSTFTRTDGSQGQIADAIFATQVDGAPVNNNPFIAMSSNATTVRLSNGETASVISGSGLNLNVSDKGVNVVISLGGNTITAGNTQNMVLVGAVGDTLNAGSGINTTLVGNGGTLLIGNASSTQYIVNGAMNTVNTGTGTNNVQVNGEMNTVNTGAGVNNVQINASNNTVNAGSGTASVQDNAANNTLNAALGVNILVSGSASEMNVAGTGGNLTISNSTVNLVTNSKVTITGAGNTTNISSANNVMIVGGNNTVNFTSGSNVQVATDNWTVLNKLTTGADSGNNTVTMWEGGSKLGLSNGTVTLADNTYITIVGNNNSSITGGAGDYVTVNGNSNKNITLGAGTSRSVTTCLVNGDSNIVTMGSGSGESTVQVNGNSNQVDTSLSSYYISDSNASVTASGTGNSITIGSSSTADLVSGSGNTVTINGASSVVTDSSTGINSFIANGGGYGSGYLSYYFDPTTVYANNGNVTVNDNKTLALVGDNNNVSVKSSGFITAAGVGNTISGDANSKIFTAFGNTISNASAGSSIALSPTIALTQGSVAEYVNVNSGAAKISGTGDITLIGDGVTSAILPTTASGVIQTEKFTQSGSKLTVVENNVLNAAGTLLDTTTAVVNLDKNSAPVSATVTVNPLTNNDLISLDGTFIGNLATNSPDITNVILSTSKYNGSVLYLGTNRLYADANSSAAVQGTNNFVAVGMNSNASVTGNGNSVVIANKDTTTIIGNNNQTQSSGMFDTVDITGSNNSNSNTGNYDSSTIVGSGNSTGNYGNYDAANCYDVNNLNVISTNNFVVNIGTHDTSNAIGSGNYVASLSSYDTTTSNGTGNSTISFGMSDITTSTGTDNTTYSYGASDITSSTGSGNTTISYANSDVTTSNGNNNLTSSYGTSDFTSSLGNNNFTSGAAANDVTYSNGNNNTTLSNGSKDLTLSIGNNNTTISNLNADFTVSNGDSNVTQSMASNDTTISNGSLNNIVSNAMNDTTCAIGSGITTTQTRANQITGVAATDLNSLINAMAAFAPTTSVQTGLLIGSTSTQPILLLAAGR
jgi:hypothetical protein